MSFPTVQGKPWFDTSGTYAQIYVQVQNDPPPGSQVTLIRIWGTSAMTTRCVNAAKTSQPAITYGSAGGILLPWDDHDPSYDSVSWVHWDTEQPYFRICVELTLLTGVTSSRLYKCGVWESVLEGDYPPSPLTDCAEGDPPLIHRSEVIVPFIPEGTMRATSRGSASRKR